MFAFASVPSNTTRILYLCNRSVTTIKKIVTTAVSVTNVTTASTIKPIQVNRPGDALLFAVHNNPCIGLPTATNIVDSSSCNHFFSCTNSQTVRQRCSGNLFYDPKINACNWPNQVDCIDGARPTTVTTTSNRTTNTMVSSTSPIVLTNTAAKTATTAQIPLNICSNLQTGQLVVDPESCTHYYSCAPSGPVRNVCPSSLFYNREASLCDIPKNVDCINGKRPNVSITTLPPLNSSRPTESTEFPIDLFSICQNATDSPSSNGFGNTGLVPHPALCTTFFSCVDGGVTGRFSCPTGTFFENKKKECVVGGPDSCKRVSQK